MLQQIRDMTLLGSTHAVALHNVFATCKLAVCIGMMRRVFKRARRLPAVQSEGSCCVAGLQISAKKGTGVDELLETVALVAELEQLMSNPDRAAAGTVLEAFLDRRIGPIATLLVQTGTLHIGDVVVCGSAYGKVGTHHTPYVCRSCLPEAELVCHALFGIRR